MNILIVTSWPYNDALIQAYTLPYIEVIAKIIPQNSKIFLVTLEKNDEKIQIKNPMIQHISLKYRPLGFMGFFMWFKLWFKLKFLTYTKKINYIHAWCTPSGMIAYLLTLFSKRKLIIDSYEPHAESMLENGTWTSNSIAYKTLTYFEKKLSKRADFLIATTKGFKDFTANKYKISTNKIFVKPACVDLNLFSENKLKIEKLILELGFKDKVVCVYAGKFGGIYLDQEVFDFIKVAEDFWGEKFRFLLLTSHSDEEINRYRENSKVKKETLVKSFATFDNIPNYMGLADFAITPVKPVASKRFCTPIKDGEYWAMGLPIVITKNISDDSEIIEKNDIGYVLQELTSDEYLKAVIEINQMLRLNSRLELYNKIRPISETHRNFEIAVKVYKEIYGN